MPRLWNETAVLEAALAVEGAFASSVVHRLYTRIGYVSQVALEFLATVLRVPLPQLAKVISVLRIPRTNPPQDRRPACHHFRRCNLLHFRPIFNSLFERRVGVGDACRLSRASATVAIGALGGGTHAKNLSSCAHYTRRRP